MLARYQAPLRRRLHQTNFSFPSIRSFSDAVTEADEEKIMETLLQQHMEREERTVLPYTQSEKFYPPLNPEPILYPEECAAVSGVDAFSADRKVKIFKPTRNQMQSGTYATRHYVLEFEPPKTWENPLMQWTSTDDPLHSVQLKFDTVEDAISFAKRQRWNYEIAESSPTGDFTGELSYSHNFLPLEIENKIKKEGKKSNVHFRHATGRQSHYVKPLKYHGNEPVAQHGGEAKE